MPPLDLLTPDAQRDPHPHFREAMAAEGPVVWSDVHRAWVVLGHRQAMEAFRHPALSSDRTRSFEASAATRPVAFRRVVDLLRGWMVFRDPPAHTRLREPVRTAFTPRRVRALGPTVAALADGLLDAIEDAGGGDLRPMLAQPLPALVIAELLGVPASDRPQFQAWSDQLARVVFAVGADARATDPAAEAAESFAGYFGGLIDHYRRHPAENLLSVLAADENRDGLSDSEVVGAATLLLFAGHETTATLIANGAWCLLAEPGQRRRVGVDPGLWPTAVEELLRYEGPSKLMARKVAAPVQLAGRGMEPGDTVLLAIAAANRDPAVFADPDRLDVGRDPNPHLGFGWGLHHCLGAALARLEAAVALRRLFERFPGLAPAADGPVWAGGVLGRAVTSVPVSLGGAA